MAAHLPLTPAWRLLLVLTGVMLMLCGCSDPLAEENEALRDEIIEVHDQAMDKIGYMFVLESRLKKLAPGSEYSGVKIKSSIAALQQANKEMFRWMNQYQTLFVDDDLSRDNAYRQQQLEMIRSVGSMTKLAIADAEHILAAD